METGLEMIAEWRKGCSVAPTKPEDCPNCTLALVNALEKTMVHELQLANCLAWYIERYRCKCGHHWCTRCKMDREATKLLERG